MESFKPLSCHIIVEEHPEDEKTEGGIILTDFHEKHYKISTVKAAGPGAQYDNGVFRKSYLLSGDVVIAPVGAGYDLKLNQSDDPENPDNREYRVLKDFDCWARVRRAGENSECLLVPISDRVIVKADPENECLGQPIVRDDGTVIQLIRSETDPDRNPRTGIALAVGPGHAGEGDGKIRRIDLQVGARVRWGRRAGINLKYQGEEFVIISELNILVEITGAV